MQDRYVGDVGDFGKYGLLRALSGPFKSEAVLSLGMVWYLVPDQGNGGDGWNKVFCRAAHLCKRAQK